MKQRITSLALSVTIVCLLATMLLAMAPGSAIAQDPQITAEAISQIQALVNEKAARSDAQRKISSDLLFAAYRERQAPILNAVPFMRIDVELGTDGRTLVDMRADVTQAVLAEIQALGGEVLSSFPQYRAIRARMPIGQLEVLAALPDIQTIRSADKAITNKTNTSEGDIAHGAHPARSTFGVDGTGVKIGVLSDSVEALESLKTSGDLPSNVTVLPDQAGTGSSEGTAMLEIVYDLAPGAELFFATALGGQAQFAQNILDLNAAGCHVIVDDVGYFAEPVFQDGVIAEAVNTVTATDPASGGSLYFSSAGNSGNLNDGTAGLWEGDFASIAAPAVVGGTAHDFGGGTNINTITTASSSWYTLQWSDPIGGSSNDYDLYLLNSRLSRVVSSSTDSQTGTQDPFEDIFSSSLDVGRALVIVRTSGADRYLHLNANRGDLTINTNGQTSGHSAAERAFSVAAVSAANRTTPFTGSEFVETFSSDGPRRIFYEADGTPITPGDFSSTGGTVRQKPDIAAADGVATATPGFLAFYGTSAAAPHAAAIGALLLDTDPSLTQAEVRSFLTSTALDIEAPGVDNDSGAGILDALTAVSGVDAALPVELATFLATSTQQGVQLSWRTASEYANLGFHVYRTQQGSEPVAVGFVKSSPDSVQGYEYQFLDDDVSPGSVYSYHLEDVDFAGERGRSNVIQVTFQPKELVAQMPIKFALLPSYPNPFNPEVWIPYELAAESRVHIRIYNVDGQMVREIDRGTQKPGRYVDQRDAAHWDGRDSIGRPVSSGVYFYQLTTDSFSATRKLVVRK